MAKIYGRVYKVTNLINGKCYIGQTIRSLRDRWKGHVYAARYCPNRKSHFYNAIRKYGRESFEITEVCVANSERDLNLKEKFYIKKFDSMKNGYNTTSGGQHPRFRENMGYIRANSWAKRQGNKVNDLLREGLRVGDIIWILTSLPHVRCPKLTGIERLERIIEGGYVDLELLDQQEDYYDEDFPEEISEFWGGRHDDPSWKALRENPPKWTYDPDSPLIRETFTDFLLRTKETLKKRAEMAKKYPSLFKNRVYD